MITNPRTLPRCGGFWYPLRVKPPSTFQYLRKFDTRPTEGLTCTFRMARPDGGETVSVGTYRGVQNIEGRDHHTFSDVAVMGPLGPFVTAWACFPVELTVEA